MAWGELRPGVVKIEALGSGWGLWWMLNVSLGSEKLRRSPLRSIELDGSLMRKSRKRYNIEALRAEIVWFLISFCCSGSRSVLRGGRAGDAVEELEIISLGV
jgi:hypothetical protein